MLLSYNSWKSVYVIADVHVSLLHVGVVITGDGNNDTTVTTGSEISCGEKMNSYILYNKTHGCTLSCIKHC